MVYLLASTFSSGYPLGVLLRAELRFSGWRRLQVFLASGACAASAASYHFLSIAPLPWHGAFSWVARVVKLGFSVLAFVSNCSLQRTATPLAELGR